MDFIIFPEMLKELMEQLFLNKKLFKTKDTNVIIFHWMSGLLLRIKNNSLNYSFKLLLLKSIKKN